MDQAIAELFEIAFSDENIVVELADEELLFYNQSVGNLPIRSGQLMAGDPMRASDSLQLAANFPNGEYPAEIAIAEFADGEEMIGYLRVTFSDKIPQQWEVARYINSSDSTLVESGIFALTDADALAVLPRIDGEERETIMNGLHDTLDQTYEPDRAWAEFSVDNFTLVACTASDEPEAYSSYIGRDASGNICRLLVDFALFEEG
ncbi:MAG: DUF4241 domain-containing protein [Bacteroidota bacterium]